MIRNIILVACMLMASQTWLRGQFVLDKVVAKVGDEYILYSDIEDQYALWSEKGALPENARCIILESQLVNSLLVHTAKIDSVIVTEDEVQRQLDARINQILSMMGNDTEVFESYYGMNISDAKELFRTDLRKKLLADRMQSTVVQNIDITPSEVIAFFNNIPKDSLPLFNSEVELGEIVYKPRVNVVEKAKALNRAKSLKERLDQGDDFAELAITYSDDPGSGRLGGDLGWNTRGTFVLEFEAAAFNLEENEISDIVETQFGFHIIQLLERLGNKVHLRHILIKPEITDADLDSARAHLERVRMEIIRDSIPFVDAVKRYSDESAQSYSNSGRLVNPKTGNTFWETADVDPDIFFAIDTIDVGDITVPLEFRIQGGEYVYKLIQLQSRTSPHRASLAKDYSRIQDAARESKKKEKFNEWIAEHIKSTYITVDAHFAGCPIMDKWNVSGVSP